jgi:cell division protein FtsQ
MKKKFKPKKSVVVTNRRRKNNLFSKEFLLNLFKTLTLLFILSALYVELPVITKAFYQHTLKAGFIVKDVTVEGQKYTSAEKISKAVKIKSGNPIFAVRLNEIKSRLESIDWIKYASVERKLPNKIHIAIIERKPIALGQKDKKLYLIDADGTIINDTEVASHLHLPIIIGEGAEINAASLISMLKVEPELFSHINSIVRISERRWNIRLDNKIEIKMPEDNFEKAWQTVIKLYKKNELFNSEIKVLDLRIANKIFVEKY